MPSYLRRYETPYELGQDNVEFWGLDLHNPVFFVSSLLILIFLTGTLIYPEQAQLLLEQTRNWVIDHFDWLFMSSANLFVLFCLVLIALPVGSIRLGGTTAKPEFSTPAWFAMLFAAGMGIGLMYWSVAEPLAYYTGWSGTPLGVAPFTPDAHRAAMGATLYHWGLHPWAIYAVVGLALAFFCFNKGLPLTLRSAFYPLLGDRVWGWPGHLIDLIAVLATLFGLATSLGFGAQQAAAGLHYLLGVSAGLPTQIAIIIGVTFCATLSVVRGLQRGVKLLSSINMWLALVLLIFVFATGPTLILLDGITANLGAYLGSLVPLSGIQDRPDPDWLHSWTIFYWAWWISWSPFVGTFIARVSRGRTVRQFVVAVLLVPTLVTLVWISVFGGTALYQAESGIGQMASGIDSVSLTMFQMLHNLPLAGLTSGLAILLVLVFFITSSDSGSLVIDSITAGGKLNAPVPQRIFWAVMEGAVAGVLLFGGGSQALSALQAGAISTGLPFTLILLLMCYCLLKGLYHERRALMAGVQTAKPEAAVSPPQGSQS